ncbi:hypothetical protein BT69DRAFT_1353514 [Atractiella rhizophila]|nr:hypothetical protein BT69DRAFT_1353514 [Atractiella rhizophila]
MFRPTLVRLARSKLTTGILGQPVHPEPLQALVRTYDATLQNLSQSSIPPSSAYRQSIEAITSHRKSVVSLALEQVKKGEDEEKAIRRVEEEFDAGPIEDVYNQAVDERDLVKKMEGWKIWEDLQTKPPAGQWDPVTLPPSNTNL